MDRADFDSTIALLSQERFRLRDSSYDERAFGSWYVVAEKNRARFRIIWDGRDRWLILQRGRRSFFPFSPERWDDEWIGKRTEDQSAGRAVRELCGLFG